jgi:PAS domain-containing protein
MEREFVHSAGLQGVHPPVLPDVGAVAAVLAEFDAQVRSVETGRLDREADASRFEGAFADIIRGGDKLSKVLAGYLEAMPLPVLTLDRDFNILYMNAAGRGLAKKDMAALRRMKCHDLFQTGDCRTKNCACGRAMDQGRLSTSETVARGTGADLDIVYSGAPITDREGRIVGAFEVITDMTAVKAAQRKIEALAQEAGRISTTLAEAAAIVREINHPNVATMFDTHNAVAEAEPHDVLVDRYFDLIRHLHVNEPDGKHPGCGHYDFLPVMSTLARRGYAGWVSVEAFDFSFGAERIMAETRAVLDSVSARIAS